jgi:hypothetical protein
VGALAKPLAGDLFDNIEGRRFHDPVAAARLGIIEQHPPFARYRSSQALIPIPFVPAKAGTQSVGQ